MPSSGPGGGATCHRVFLFAGISGHIPCPPVSDENDWRDELRRLRARLRDLEEQHATALRAVRGRISALEERLEARAQLPEPTVTATGPPPVEPATAAEPPPEPAKPAAVPPPLPPPPPKAATAEDAPPGESLEFRLGRVWFVRIGVALLLTGLVLLGNYAYQNWVRDLPNGIRLAALYVCAIGLAECGRRLARGEKLARFGEVVLAGGLAFFYYCTFAAHHVDRLRVVDSPILAAVLLFLAAGAIGAVSWLRQAKATAVLGLLLASYSTMLQPIGWLSCLSNVLLAGAGVALMLRPGWAGPGIAAMVGIYASFLGWQIAGAAGGRPDNVTSLWFLPPVWALFALPGIVGNFRASMSERARFWFAGSNNAAFFVLFSALWLMRGWDESYWLVSAVFGAILLALGVAARRRANSIGGVHAAQGIGLLSLALVLKLDGHHLGLALAIESLALAAAAWRFRTRSEFAFSVIAGTAAVLVILVHGDAMFPSTGQIPLWSAALAAALVGASSVLLNRAAGDSDFRRLGSGIVFFAALAAASAGFALRLPEPWPLPSLTALATLVAFATLRLDPRRTMAEAAWGSLLVLALAVLKLPESPAAPAIGAAAILAMAACWLWHRQPGAASEIIPADPARHPATGAWMNATFVVAATWTCLFRLDLETPLRLSLTAGAGVALTALAIAGSCGRLAPCAALLPVAAALESAARSGEPWPIALLSWTGLALLALRWRPDALAPLHRLAAGGLLRVAGFVAWCISWARHAPETWGDWIALSALGLVVVAVSLRRPLAHEATAFLVVATGWFAWRTLESPWLEIADPSWRGAGVALAFLATALTQRQRPSHFEGRRERMAGVALNHVACALATAWTTQILVWRYGWQPASVAWTFLGFAAISTGLWLRLRAFRIFGFLLLAIALLKLFAVDVWDFSAFTRVAAFIALGVALMLLGLFYHRFAPVLKRMVGDDKGD